MPLSARTPIGRLATDHPASMRVFERHNLDYCCSGGRPLEEACVERGVDVETVVREIEDVLTHVTPSEPDTGWRNASSEELIGHIVEAYHRPLRRELPRLGALARKVSAAHGARHPSLQAVVEAIVSLSADLHQHMAEEEEVFFPRILRGASGDERASVESLEHDHAEAGAALERIRELTGDYSLPPEACNSWRALWSGLETLERTTHEHVHLENNILFPRELAR